MMLLTKENRRALPPLYSSENSKTEPEAVVKFFDPGGSWTWYATEFDGDDLFWGLVDGHEAEYGYFRLSELMAVRNRLGLGVERDRHFRPESLAALKDAANERRL